MLLRSNEICFICCQTGFSCGCNGTTPHHHEHTHKEESFLPTLIAAFAGSVFSTITIILFAAAMVVLYFFKYRQRRRYQSQLRQPSGQGHEGEADELQHGEQDADEEGEEDMPTMENPTE